MRSGVVARPTRLHLGEGLWDTLAGRIMRRLRFLVREIEREETMIKACQRRVQMVQESLSTRRALCRCVRGRGNAGIDTLAYSLVGSSGHSGSPSQSVRRAGGSKWRW